MMRLYQKERTADEKEGASREAHVCTFVARINTSVTKTEIMTSSSNFVEHQASLETVSFFAHFGLSLDYLSHLRLIRCQIQCA